MDHGTTSLTMACRFKPYPAYKDSSVEWLGKIPVHWETAKLKRVCTFAYGEALAADARVDGNVQVYGSNGPVGSHDRANPLAPCLVIGSKGLFGKVNYAPQPVFGIDTTFLVDRRYTRADIRWLYYALTDARLDSATKDSAIPGLDREDAYSRDLAVPPIPEQRAIAAFLDREDRCAGGEEGEANGAGRCASCPLMWWILSWSPSLRNGKNASNITLRPSRTNS